MEELTMEELTDGLDSAVERANPTYEAVLGNEMWYEQLPNLAAMSTSSAVVSVIFLVWSILCGRKMFAKAWLPGWGILIPFYNIYLWFKLAGMSGWWLLSLLLPPVFLVAVIVSYFKVAKNFGKSWRFGLGLWFLNPIFSGILAFDKSTYQG